jgi:hypothetical protein
VPPAGARADPTAGSGFPLTSLLQWPLQRLQFLDRIASALHHAEGLEAAIEVAGEGLVPQFADVVIVVVEQLASEQRIEVISARPDQVPDLTDSLRSHLPALRRVARAEAAEERRFRWVPKVTPVSTRFLQREPAVQLLLNTPSWTWCSPMSSCPISEPPSWSSWSPNSTRSAYPLYVGLLP